MPSGYTHPTTHSLTSRSSCLRGLLKMIKLLNFSSLISSIQSKWRKRPLPLQLFLLLCLNLAIAPAVQAASRIELARGQAYAIALLGLITLGLSIYLFVVIFQPEKF